MSARNDIQGVPPVFDTESRASRPWGAWALMGALFSGITLLVAFVAAWDLNLTAHPTDEELTRSFLANEGKFAVLLDMLRADSSIHPFGTEKINLSVLAAAGVDPARVDGYRKLLAAVDGGDFWYAAQSGNLAVDVPRASSPLRGSVSYVYLNRDQPRPSSVHARSYWRGPGGYVRTGDTIVKGQWFIHHEYFVDVHVFPY